MRIVRFFVVMMLIAAPALAADVDGQWTGALDTPNGAVDIAYTFKADGTSLTGTTTGPDGTVLAIKNGKIDGNKISFSIDVDFGGMALTIVYSGVVSAEQIALTLDIMGMPLEMTVKKAK